MYGQGKTRGQSAVLEIEATANQACFAILPNQAFHPECLQYWFQFSYSQLRDSSHWRGGNQSNLKAEMLAALKVPWVDRREQVRVAEYVRAQFDELDTAQNAVLVQVKEISRLADAIISDSVRNSQTVRRRLGDVLEEVKQGIGVDWATYPVLGATRDGLAPAKERPGKHASK